MELLVILQALSHIREQRKGQNLENVVSHCCKELDLDRSKVLRAVNHATWDELISQTSKDDVVLLRINDGASAIEESNCICRLQCQRNETICYRRI